MEYVRAQFARRPHDVWMVVHEVATGHAKTLAAEFPGVRIATHPRLRSKVLLIEPRTAIVGSANFGSSGYRETTVSIRSESVHAWYAQHVFELLWADSTTV